MEKLPEICNIKDEEQAKAYLHPVRVRILQLLSKEVLTISQTATRFNIHPANLTHHFRKLLDTGLIKLVEEKDTGRAIEKYYRSIASCFQITHKNVSPPMIRQNALNLLLEDMREAQSKISTGDEDLVCFLVHDAISEQTFKQFQKELGKLVKKYRQQAKNDATAKNTRLRQYSLNLSLYRKDD